MFRDSIATLIQLSAALVLIFAGWGFNDLAAYFGCPARMGLVAMIALGAGTAVALRVPTRPIRRGLSPLGSQNLQLGVLLALSLMLLAFLPFADRHNRFTFHSSLLRWAGLLLCGQGGLVRLFAMRRLGRHFSAFVTLQPRHQLVQDGIYASIRHPLYLSLLLVPAGIALVFASFLAVPIFVLSAIFVADRITKEERLLAEGFGPEFAAYRRRTRMLIPGIL